MPNVDFGACVSNYWFVWSINGLGSIFGMAINMAVSFFFLKYFLNAPSTPNVSTSAFDNITSTSATAQSSKV
ncbi:unnamed protein product [Rotaria sordida]|uniref:Uncharacterized protein n=1 Tax=Rotaria sordida TaxID=392033 RepID=A0A818VWL4_9BILA|nr:unnamed protein product [Rotaria sordida]CAF1134298.1 unnamed protein product [Rotaria sordida]CAF1146182.1 unnamed protein product [Rotaria sordida]CAF3716644.1 unnamed protein product [Rotaria sordida]CAF3783432.1 unnamed protein product [Rotaria sordida]